VKPFRNSIFLGTLILLIVLTVSQSCSKSDPPIKPKAEFFHISQFIEPDTCGDCHSDIFEQWQNSMHHLAQKDPIYLSVSQYMLKGLTDRGEIKESESCVKCHVPVGVVTGYPQKTSDDTAKIPELAMEGIQCDYCHSATGAEKLFNNDLKLSPGNGDDDPGIKRGPRDDAESDYHSTEFSAFHTDSAICGTCHNVKHVAFDTDLETTYDEWLKGPYNTENPDTRVTCQGCHMYQRPGMAATGSTKRPASPGVSAEDGLRRDHVFTHYFVGANTFVPDSVKDETKADMARARLQNAATLSLDASQKKEAGRLVVKISNTGAGHYLPTGLTDVRQMWLEVTVTDPDEKIVFASGKPDKNGWLPKETTVYNTVFGDGQGNPIVNIAKAREILKDNRIPPLKSAYVTILLPDQTLKTLIVNVKLQYRSAPQRLMDQVNGQGKIKLPVVTMAEIEKQVF
jgi:hypothetical protein